MAGSTVSWPVEGAIEYCDTVLPPRLDEPLFATNIQLSSPRITIETGPIPVAIVGGLKEVKAPVIGLILSGEIVLERVPRT